MENGIDNEGIFGGGYETNMGNIIWTCVKDNVVG